jgi:predicted LPLAT superfamily acyltransferase
MEKGDWQGKTGGGRVGQRALFKILRSTDVRYLYPILYITVPISMLIHQKEYKAIYYLYRKRLHHNPIMAFFLCLRNFITFSKIVADKFATLAGNTSQFKVEVKDRDIFTQMLNQSGGFITVGAHIGNFEMAGCSLQQDNKKFNFVFWGGESEEITNQRLEAFKKVNPDAKIITIGDNISYLFDIKSALDNGEALITACDRLCGSPKHYETEFLGKKAFFPLGIFMIAAKLKVPVLTVHIFKGKSLKYEGFVKELKYNPSIKSSLEQAESLAKQYIEILEQAVLKHPLQWFNYYNFWNPIEN